MRAGCRGAIQRVRVGLVAAVGDAGFATSARRGSRNQFRGIVHAPDEKSAEAAIAEFKVRGDMRRLIVRRTDE